MKKLDRNYEIDFIKAFVIIILPFTHCYISFDGTMKFLVDVIKLYQMPILMIISGYCIKMSDKNIMWLRNRFFRLFVPAIIWSIIYFRKELLNGLSPQLVDTMLSNYAWFLFVLFIFNLFTFGYEIICKHLKFMWWRGILFLSFTVVLNVMALILDSYFVSLVAWHWIFYSFGYYLRRRKDRIFKFENYCLKYFLIIFISTLSIVFMLYRNDVELSKLGTIGYGINIGFRYINAFMAIIAVYLLAKQCPLAFKKKLVFISESTMYVYLTHFIFVRTVFVNNIYLNMMLQWVSGVLISLCIAYFAKRYKIRMIQFIYGG